MLSQVRFLLTKCSRILRVMLLALLAPTVANTEPYPVTTSVELHRPYFHVEKRHGLGCIKFRISDRYELTRLTRGKVGREILLTIDGGVVYKTTLREQLLNASLQICGSEPQIRELYRRMQRSSGEREPEIRAMMAPSN